MGVLENGQDGLRIHNLHDQQNAWIGQTNIGLAIFPYLTVLEIWASYGSPELISTQILHNFSSRIFLVFKIRDGFSGFLFLIFQKKTVLGLADLFGPKVGPTKT